MMQPQYRPYAAGESPLERLPSELLCKILRSVNSQRGLSEAETLAYDLRVSPNAKRPSSPCLYFCLLTSKTTFEAALPIMYRNIQTTVLSTLVGLLSRIQKSPRLGRYVRILDLSGIPSSTKTAAFSNIGFNSLLEVLSRSPLLRHIRIGCSLEEFLDEDVLELLFFGLHYLESLEISNCNSTTFHSACSNVFSRNLRIITSLNSLSLPGCSEIRAEIFENILSQLPKLQRLNVSGTQISAAALLAVPPTASITHLDIGHCYALDTESCLDFLESPVTRHLVHLNLGARAGLEHRVFESEDVGSILEGLSSNARNLSFKNSAMSTTHIQALRGVFKELEELSVGAHLRLRDLESLFFGAENLSPEKPGSESVEIDQTESKYGLVLTPMEEAVAVCQLRREINTTPEPLYTTKLRYLDISSLSVAEQCKMQTSAILGPQTLPLHTVEISEKVLRRGGSVLKRVCNAVGWEVESVERRCWLRRR